MPEVRIAERRIWVGEQSRVLLSGEVHFWRLDPAVWPTALDRLRELGLEIVSTYVCWAFHELKPGHFDFRGEGDGRRDLLKFLDLAQERGLWVLLRPGPYIYAEWPNSGIPDRTVQWHRLHPEFVREAKTWMAAVVQAVRDRLATHGGPIVLWQADNEADPWFDVYGRQLGLADSPGLFQAFLRSRYVQIADLNRAWGAEYRDFAEARAVMTGAVHAFAERFRDVTRFRHWHATELVRWTTDEYRRLGVDVPIYANTYIDTAVQDWRAIDGVCDLVGPDIYPTSSIAERSDEHRQLLDALRYARCASRLAFVPEFESGIWHGWHSWIGTLSATHYELIGWSALLAGACGWNWYMLVGRDSWYMSPIGALGRARPDLAPTFADLVRLFREVDPPSLTKVCRTAVTFSALERAADPEAGQPVLRALYEADIDYDFADLSSDSFPSAQVLFYAGGAMLEPHQLHRLGDYVERGGTLVCLQPPALSGLVSAPVAVTTAATPQRLRVRLGDDEVELSSADVFVYPEDVGEPIFAERSQPLAPTQEGGHAHVLLPVGERLCIGYAARRGSGRILVLGVAPGPTLLAALHAWLGVRVPCRAADSPRLQTAIFRRDGEYILIVTNTAAEARDALISLDLDALPRSAVDLRTGRAAPLLEGGPLVHVPGRSGTILRLT